eukprot:TRINITY_DN10036_c0_g2_i1.p1 TRINITY_DN10036_c0_g2~~TRINITY_DN10036_c0_g2_i1.p1  ORF type:complete len:429 (+),score=67.19 TRINITY_DN10036_c0_g2_i1:80-1288(+)
MSEKQPLLSGGAPTGAPPPAYAQPPPASAYGAPPAAAYGQQPGPPPPAAGNYPPQQAGSPPPPAAGSAAVPSAPMEVVVPPSVAPPSMVQYTPFQLPPQPSPSQQELQDALVDTMGKACCAGSTAAREMKIDTVVSKNCYIYKLYTFTEKRSTHQKTVAYTNEFVDGPEHGRPPHPWSIGTVTPHPFQPTEQKLPVPHTAFVHTCNHCAGMGNNKCSRCNGIGHNPCPFCRATGRTDNGLCGSCQGRGQQQCHTCNGSGRCRCRRCQGSGRLMTYTELVVIWSTHESQRVFDEDGLGLPLQKIVEARPHCLMELQGQLIAPISNSPLPKVDNASVELINNHNQTFTQERTLQQKQQVLVVPISNVTATWEGRTFHYYRYGCDHRIHAPEYPQSGCCWCCTIM